MSHVIEDGDINTPPPAFTVRVDSLGEYTTILSTLTFELFVHFLFCLGDRNLDPNMFLRKQALIWILMMWQWLSHLTRSRGLHMMRLCQPLMLVRAGFLHRWSGWYWEDFLHRPLITIIRSQNKLTLATATSNVAASIMPSG